MSGSDRVAPKRGVRSWRPPVIALAALVTLPACGGADDVVYRADRVEVFDADALPATTTTVALPSGPILVDRIWSPEPTIAEVLGSGAMAGDPITVDGEPADVVTFDVEPDGSFLLRVRIVDEGAYTVCVRDGCGRVFVEPEPADGADRGDG